MQELPEHLFASPIFAHLDSAARAELASHTRQRQVDAGRLIVAEGAPADSMFVVLEGSAQVFTQHGAESPIVLARREAGEHFGEQALLPGRTGYRSASVLALTDVRLAEIPAVQLRRHLAMAPQLERELLELGNQQLRERLSRKCDALRFLDFGSDDQQRLGSAEFAPGQLLMRQGEAADCMHLIVSGDVEVYEEKGARRRMLHRLSAGLCVGELGLVNAKPRGASVRALTHVETLTVSAAHFHDLLTRSAGLRDHVKTLQRCLALHDDGDAAANGFMTQYAGLLDGAECVTTACRMDDARHVVASLLTASGTYHVDVTRPGPAALAGRRVLRYPHDGPAQCEISLVAVDLSAMVIESATAIAEWPDLRQLHRQVLADAPWSEAFIAGFLHNGRLPAATGAVQAGDADLLCGCMRVSYDSALSAVLSGCADVAELGRATGCGTVCGGCKPRLTAMLGETGCTPATLEEVIALTPDVRALRLQPRGGQAGAHRPGQHILLEGWIGGHWVRRSYTLSSAPRHGGSYEISVKREAHGVLSPWLFERAPGDPGLRVSEPRGAPLDLVAGRPLVCFVAGIGITPALSQWRAFADAGASTTGLLHYCARSAAQAAWLDELRSISSRMPGLELLLRETGREGRLSRNDVKGIVGRFQDAAFFVCGPGSFVADVCANIASCGVPPQRIESQHFDPAGAPAVQAAQSASGNSASGWLSRTAARLLGKKPPRS